MNLLKIKPLKDSDSAVSPVVGVMLMLVVTIIIAAVVSGFAGGLVDGTDQNAPLLTMDVKISNTGSYIGSGFSATVTSVSDPIPTKDIKIATSWKITDDSGDVTPGGSTTTPLVTNVRCPRLNYSCAPYGYGPGVISSSDEQYLTKAYKNLNQHFGNYSLVQGTGLIAYPYGSYQEDAIGSSVGMSDTGGYGVVTGYTYSNGGLYWRNADAAQSVLGTGWEALRVGDTVNVKVIHIPTGKVIFEKNVAVTEG
ncbi:FlaG/FlaF family flagellin (archaellin) [Methanomicrobium sp. W14]|uniref:type IV pilin n=1 Tax=Methanomicrobium sp. W14 TaxID=2817839 RepID=UPI001AE2B0E2|nr:type IV pilin N-terminal domain-containing protein [Methanomicrobium sp. W14]MBP2134052.1 FlaG/FlaF family flagellin (archaellin) [Methanomicrobium sp. W14]